jgi:excisionase family DNA binding protein
MHGIAKGPERPTLAFVSEPTRESDVRCLTVAQTAERLGICSRTVWNLIKRGELPAVRIGRRLAIPVSRLQEFITAHIPTPPKIGPDAGDESDEV